MAYKGYTVKYRISSNHGTCCTVESRAEVDAMIDKLIQGYEPKWVAVDRIETTRILHKRTKESDS